MPTRKTPSDRSVEEQLNQVPWFRDVTGDIEALLKPARLH